MPRPRRRAGTCRVDCDQPDAETYVKRQRCDSSTRSVGITIALEDRTYPSCVSSPYRRVPELSRGSSRMSSSGRVLRADDVVMTKIRLNSVNEQGVQGLELNMDNQTHVHRRRKYLRPGQIAQLVGEHKKSRISNAALGKRSAEVAGMSTQNLASSMSRSPVSTVQVFGPTFPQRKKLVAPRTPLTPASQLTVVRDSMREVDFSSQPGSSLESLPVELLVHIVCRLHHDQLEPVFRVCRSLQEAVNIAREMHFNFTTPDYERQKSIGLYTPKRHRDIFRNVSEAPGGVLDVRPSTPQAPRHAPKPAYARIPLAEMNAVVAPLFQGRSDTPHRPAALPRLTFKAVASHRVLFNEEEFRQGGALAA